MRAPRVLDGVRSWRPSQRALRAVVLVGPLVALLTAGAAGHAPAGWIVVVVAVLAATWAAAPESGVGTLTLLLVLFWWSRVPGDGLHPSVLVAAAAVVAAHVCAVMAGAAPPRTPVDRAVVRLWARRGLAVLAVSPVLWAVARVLRDEPAPGLVWPAALAAVEAAVVLLSVALGRPQER